MAKKILRVGTLSRIGTTDIHRADDSVSAMVLKEIFETPYCLPTGPENPEPLLLGEPLKAEPGDSKRPIFSALIRKGVLFSDGTPLTAEIMRASLATDDDVRARAAVEVSADRIVFKLISPDPGFPIFLSHTACGVMLQRGERFIGTGPYMFLEGISARDLLQANPLVLVKNPHYRSPIPIDEIHFSMFPPSSGGGTENLLAAAKEGAIDFTYSLTSVDAAELQGFPFMPSISTGNSTGMLILNTTAPSLRNPVVRKAIARSIDRRQIASKAYPKNPLAYVASSILPPLMGRESKETLSFNPREVAAMLEREKVTLPSRLSLQILWSPRPYMPNPKEAAEVIREQLSTIGISVNVVTPKSRDEFLDTLKKGAFELSLSGWISDTADPADFLESCLASWNISNASKVTSTSNNHAHYASPAMDKALQEFRANQTAEARARIMELLEQDAPILPLIYGQMVAVYARRIRGFRASAISSGRMSFSKVDLTD
ncbi:MAG TPA: ABC transporter substrate-binding protein [Thermoanaerobaculia bacterium]|nr:ABC transporter substrate-binding protein [Thermoanaerobaculia bacterium]